MIEWIRNHAIILWWLAAPSMIIFIAAVIAGPLWAVRILADYFGNKESKRKSPAGRNAAQAILAMARNLLGGILVMAGMVMLVLPGQGFLTILAGIMLTDFPGKYRIARWIVARRPVLHSINWLRRRAGRDPLVVEQ